MRSCRLPFIWNLSGWLIAGWLSCAIDAPALGMPTTLELYHVHDFQFRARVPGNPFDVDLRGEFIGPGGTRITVPGFYDGENTWKIRFAPTVIGRWSLQTVSSVAALNGKMETQITATANRNPAIHGGLQVDPLNRHHFIYADGTRYFLMGYEADWLAEADMNDPQRKVMHHLIDQISTRGFNHVLVNVYAYDTLWAKGHTSRWDYGPPPLFVFWGTNNKPDHTRLNTAYFKIFDGLIYALQDKGIVVNLMFKVYNKLVAWPAPGSPDEERYFRYVTARYQAFSNVTWDFSKEAYGEPNKPLEIKLIDLIRATDGYHRLITVHDNDLIDWDPTRNGNLDFRTDQEHYHWKEMLIFDRNLRAWPIVNAELYYERGVDALPTYSVNQDWQQVLRGAYEVYLSGGYFVYYYDNTAWDIIKPDPEPPGMARFQILRETLSSLPYWRMEPKPELAAGGPCLAIPGQVYAFYVTPSPPDIYKFRDDWAVTGSQREIVVNLTALIGPATLEWVNTWTGEHESDRVEHPGVYQFFRPKAFADAPALLIVKTVQ